MELLGKNKSMIVRPSSLSPSQVPTPLPQTPSIPHAHTLSGARYKADQRLFSAGGQNSTYMEPDFMKESDSADLHWLAVFHPERAVLQERHASTSKG